MTKLVAGMTMSLDGFIQDARGSSAALYPDLQELRRQPPLREAIETTGAVMMGRRTFEMAKDPDWFAGNYEFQTPIVVVTRHPPARHPKEGGGLSFIFAGDGLDAAVPQAKRAAAGRDVHVVGGAQLVRSLIRAGRVDELQVDIMPILLGSGLRLFDDIETKTLRLKRALDLPQGRVCLAYSFA